MQSIPIEEAEALKQLVGDRYQLQSLLGNNPGRKTLLAIDNETGNQVVLKLLLFGKEFAWQDLKLFEREAETLRSLEHSAIPQYLDYFDVESTAVKGFALVQSYIDARSLATQVAAGRRFSEEELEQIAQQLLEILEYLHSRQPAVIHRDIKPSNILLTGRTAHAVGQVYLVDFGSVQTLAAREGGTITVVGTYGYMPPEQFGGRAVPASDLYSLGATLIYLASGRHPADLPQDELRLEFEDFVQLSPRMVDWLQVLVQPGLTKRVGDASTALVQIEKVSTEETTDSSSLSTLVPPSSSNIRIFRENSKFILTIPNSQLRFQRFNRTKLTDKILIGIIVSIFSGIFLVAAFNELMLLGADPSIIGISVILLGALSASAFTIFSPRKKQVIIEIEETCISIQIPCKEAKLLDRKHVWQLRRDVNNAIQVSIGDWRVLFYVSREEQDWLIQVLSKELGLPEAKSVV